MVTPDKSEARRGACIELPVEITQWPRNHAGEPRP